MNNSFFPSENYIIDNADKIRDIPVVIVQGRYDVVCPITSAWELHRALPEAEFIVVPDAGHSVSEPGITSALVEAMDAFKGVGL
jgi:proline iminopeptidase